MVAAAVIIGDLYITAMYPCMIPTSWVPTYQQACHISCWAPTRWYFIVMALVSQVLTTLNQTTMRSEWSCYTFEDKNLPSIFFVQLGKREDWSSKMNCRKTHTLNISFYFMIQNMTHSNMPLWYSRIENVVSTGAKSACVDHDAEG